MDAVRDGVWQSIQAIPEDWWWRLTWLGDSGLLVPVAALIALWLASSRRTWPAAAAWIAIFGVASSLVLVSKLAFLGWGVGSARFNFTGISGHTMLSASVWPVALWLLASRRTHALRVRLAVFGWLLAACIGVSRLAIYAHSGSEVVAGYLLGVAASASFLAVQRSMDHPKLRSSLVALSLMLPLLQLQPGHAAPTHGLIERMAMHLAGIERPFTREDLHRPSKAAGLGYRLPVL